MTPASLEQRVVRAAQAALAERRFVAPIDVLIGIGWLAPVHVDIWRQGRVADLETLTQANLSKLSEAIRLLRGWAADRGLWARETVYVARTRDRHPLRFSRSGNPEVERGTAPTGSPRHCRRRSVNGSRSARAAPPTWW